LKIENPATGGSETDPFPTEANPSEDYVAAKGFAFENLDTRAMDLDGSGNIQFKDATETTYVQLWKLRRAIYEIFDPTGTGLVSVNTEDAIKEIYGLAESASKGFIFAEYNGNANTGRYLEFFNAIDSNEAPLYSDTALEVIEIVAATTATNATCTIGFYNNTTLLYTVTFSAVKRVTLSGLPLFTLPATGSLKVKIDSGSITKPHLYFVARGA
jgi:hypothetical protein